MSQQPPPMVSAPALAAGYERRWLAMFVLLAANFMTLLDVGIVNVALRSVQDDLQGSDLGIQWVAEIYILVYALGLLPLGRMGDIRGRKRMFIAGVVGFTAASVLCGAAPSMSLLIAARGLQGLAAAMITPQVMAIAQTMFAPRERAGAFSLFGLVSGVAAIAGPLASGLLIYADIGGLGWRMVFLINVPLGVATFAAALAFVPSSPSRSELKHDTVGIALATAAILTLIFPLVEGRAQGWPLWGTLTMLCFGPLLLSFVAWERKQARDGGSALLPTNLMQHRDYLVGSLALTIFFSALQGFFLVFALFLQKSLNFSPLQTGLSAAPFPVGVLVATFIVRRFADLKGKIVSGSLALATAFGALCAVVSGSNLGVKSFVVPLLVGGIGAGVTIASLFQGVMRSVPLKDAGSASGAVQVMQQLGGALGVALVSVIYFSQLSFVYSLAYCVAAYLIVSVLGLSMRLAPLPDTVAAAPLSSAAR